MKLLTDEHDAAYRDWTTTLSGQEVLRILFRALDAESVDEALHAAYTKDADVCSVGGCSKPAIVGPHCSYHDKHYDEAAEVSPC